MHVGALNAVIECQTPSSIPVAHTHTHTRPLFCIGVDYVHTGSVSQGAIILNPLTNPL